jgi:hypothetical protein
MAWKFRDYLAALPRSNRQRCGAFIPQSEARLYRAISAGRLDEYLGRSGHRCRNWAVRGGKRCRFHGGYSTGPRTPEGMARTVAALKAGRARWMAKLKSEGRPIPGGRKKGGRNLPKDERGHAEFEKQCRHRARDVRRQILAERKPGGFSRMQCKREPIAGAPAAEEPAGLA